MGMICQHCQGPVDVSSHNGAMLRCGCGKTIVTTPPRAAPAEQNLRALLRLLTEHRVSVYRAGDVQIELDSSAWATAAPAEPKPEPDKQCACGHALHDHNQTGCVLGCPVETCGVDA